MISARSPPAESEIERPSRRQVWKQLGTRCVRDLKAGPALPTRQIEEIPAPLIPAARKKVRTAIRIAYAWFIRAFREGAEYLRRGDRLARVPNGSFPPGLPFVRAGL